MQTVEYIFTDKAKWGDGPWQGEVDKKQWTDAATGLPCLIVRGPSGALCGYVGVSEEHPFFNRDYDSIDIYVHGGLTYAAPCAAGEPEHGICHLPGDGEPDHVWWLGFDCAHSGDFCPRSHSVLRVFWEGQGDHETYRTQAYVEAECASLAQQLKAFCS